MNTAMSNNILDAYVMSTPSPQNVLDIFQGEWTSRFPAPLADCETGCIRLFTDVRIKWFLEEIGGVEDRSVLELGPLEGAHTCMLEQAGAACVVAIESNTRSYLKCLITKELLELRRVQFLCGDFVNYLREDGPMFDVCLASGVLYHVQNPAELISLLAKRCIGDLLLWTHYYDPDIIASKPAMSRKFTGSFSSEHEGFRHTLYRQEYKEGLGNVKYCGGTRPESNWMARDEILACLQHFGFQNLRINFDHPRHLNGPSLAVVASAGRTAG